MKIFNSLKDLFKFINLCSVCGSERKIEPHIGPDFSFKLASFSINKNSLIINCVYNLSFDEMLNDSYKVKFTVNLLNNSYDRELVGDDHFDQNVKEGILSELDSTEFWISFNCSCRSKTCNLHTTATTDIIFEPSDFTIDNLGLENEDMWLVNGPYKYYVDSWPQEDKSYVAKIYQTNDGFYQHHSLIEIPYIPIQFSNLEKIIKKIRMLATFS